MALAEVAAKLGISRPGCVPLLAIDPDEPRPMRQLAQAMNCDASYATAMVDDLERRIRQRRPSRPTVGSRKTSR